MNCHNKTFVITSYSSDVFYESCYVCYYLFTKKSSKSSHQRSWNEQLAPKILLIEYLISWKILDNTDIFLSAFRICNVVIFTYCILPFTHQWNEKKNSIIYILYSFFNFNNEHGWLLFHSLFCFVLGCIFHIIKFKNKIHSYKTD